PSAKTPALQLLDAVLEARGGVAGWLSLDGAEFFELEQGSPSLPRLLAPVLQAANLLARIHLNSVDPPSWAGLASHGPLFDDQAGVRSADHLNSTAIIVQAVLALHRDRCPFAIDWHVGQSDFGTAMPGARSELLEVMARAALGEYPITFVFDR